MSDCSGVISQLFIYPVKSCAGIEVNAATLQQTGLEMDREWMIVDQHGQFLTQRQCPHMVWITPSLSPDALTLSAPDCEPVRIALDFRGRTLDVTVWRDTVVGDDMGDHVAKWLDEFLAIPGKQFRLVRFSKNTQRLSAREWTRGVDAPNMFSDGFALLVVTQGALDTLNGQLAEQGHDPVSMLRFRPNIVIEGLEAHAEDHLAHLTLQTIAGPVVLDLVKPCPRCPIPDIDPFTASSSPEVSQTLAKYRALEAMKGAVCFGMNAIVRSGTGHILHTGQAFEADYRV